MADNLTKEQRKRKAKKEAQKKKKAEKQNEDPSVKMEKGQEEQNANENEAEEADNFESELCWCIEQLELGIKHKRPSKEEAQKALKMIKTLQSEKTAKVRKRQIMHNTFGNYRKKMTDDMKRSSIATLEPKFVAVAEDKLKKSIYVKSKAHQPSSNLSGSRLETASEADKWTFKASNNSFMFSFSEPSS